MGIQQRIFQQGDGLDTLRDLLSIVKNPDLITKAHETFRQQVALSEGAQKTADDAQAYIIKHRDLAKAMNDEQAKLESERAEHETNLSNFSAYKDNETIRLKDIAKSLDDRVAQLNEDGKRLNAERIAFENEKKSVENRIKAISEEAQTIKNAAEKASAANELKEKQLSDWETELKAKAQKLKDAANF